jgi:hypothetical protein
MIVKGMTDKRLMKKILIFALMVLSVLKVSAQQWIVPEDKKEKVSPFKFTDETVLKGQAVFQRNCQSCHGEPGKGNFVNLTPPPGDPATGKFQTQVDGALFYKMTTGRSPMPQFKEILSEEERWQVISYFRSFNKNYVQPSIETGKTQAKIPKADLAVSYLPETKQIKVIVSDTAKKPVPGAEITLSVKRYFGHLPIGEAIRTNKDGVALFAFSSDIPGDKKGNVDVIVKLNSEKDGDSQKILQLAIGVPTNKPSLTLQRAMWSNGLHPPIWLLLTYTTVVVGIWGFLVYIILQIIKIKKANHTTS